jgi:serine/threonine-protein kinase
VARQSRALSRAIVWQLFMDPHVLHGERLSEAPNAALSVVRVPDRLRAVFPLALSPGSRIAHYDIVSSLGAGGMGEVYRARDTRLDRDVALKILPESFASDSDRLMRFTREAKTLASLNHSNIAQIYGIEGGALVMELVEGEDLSTLIAGGAKAPPLHSAGAPGLQPRGGHWSDALPIARQIAEALEAAHEQGIIHRDLKPANIKVRADGTVKVLDFGLAKALAPGTQDSGPGTRDSSATMTSPATAIGLILGTAAYMSPEQARGRPVDKRADIWAFGVVLFEMLTGRRLFGGDDISITLANVLKEDVRWAELPADLPAPIHGLLRRCLERDPRRRLRDIGEAWVILANPEAAVPSAVQAATSFASRPALVLMTVLAVACLVLGVQWFRAASGPDLDAGAAVRFPLVRDSAALRVVTDKTQPFAVSPDGRTVVFSADDGRGVHLWVRTLDEVEPRRLDDTEGGFQPAISPNGEWVAFVVTNYHIRKVRLSGGPASTIATLDNVTAAVTWLSDDEVAFEMIGVLAGIHRASANGTPPELLIPFDETASESGQRRPLALPGDGLLLYTSRTTGETWTLAAYSLNAKRRVRLELPAIQALGVIDGHLIYSSEGGLLMAVPFDAAGMQLRGEPRQLIDRVERSGFGTPVALSASGTLVFTPPGGQASRLSIRQPTGGRAPLGDWVRAFDTARFSPDGKWVAVSIGDGDDKDLWVVNRQTAEPTRVTRGSYDDLVDWTDDSLSLIHLRGSQIWITPVDRRAEPRVLVKVEGRVSAAASVPGGQSVLAVRANQGNLSGLWRVLVSTGAEQPIVPAATSGQRPRPIDARVSPNGKWVAFTDRNEQEVHVMAIDGHGAVQVSSKGGSRPVWGPRSDRVFYETSEGLTVAELQTSPSLAVGPRAVVTPAITGIVHDVAANDGTLLVVEPTNNGPGVLVAFGWAADVRRQLRK